MSVVFTNTPEPFQPVLSDGLFFTVSSSTYDVQSTFKFRYVYDLYINGDLEFQGKCSPNPFGLGIIDLQQILESYTNSLPIASWSGTPVYVHQTFPFGAPWNDETLNYQIKVGYEYSDSEIGSITGFTGIGNTIGEPSFSSENYKTFRSTMGVNGRATQQSFDIGPFVLSGTPTSVFPTTTGLFLTNAPRIQDISTDEWYTLGFTNYYMNSGSTPTILSEPYYVEFRFYDDDGVLITGTTHDNILSNGGGPREDCNWVYPAMYLVDPPTGVSFNTMYVGCGPKNIPYFPNNTRQYTVQLYGVFEGTTSPYEPPVPTPTPTSSGLPPRPSPTPSSTPPCSGCTRYTIEYTGGSAFGSATYVNCTNGAVQTFNPLPTVIYVICSCSLPTGDDLDIVDLGPCTDVTPTPTPTPCNCVSYRATNETGGIVFLSYVDCSREFVVVPLDPFEVLFFCACEGSVVADDTVIVVNLGPCVTPTPTPTPLPPTATPSATPPCLCIEYEFANNTGSPTTLNYVECDGTPISAIIPADSTVIDCACEGSVEPNPSVIVTNLGDCVE
jgi:hypothetical protein